MNKKTKAKTFILTGIVATACIGFGAWALVSFNEKTKINSPLKENKEMSTLLQSGAPNHLVRDDGSYSLIAIIDGAGANKQFISNLQVINVQRQALGELRNKVSSMPKSATDSERSGLTKRAAEIEASLVKNMDFMTKSYGYSTDQNFLLVPLKANVLEKGKDEEGNFSEDETKGSLVKTINSTEAYEHFESLRAEYSAAAAEGGDTEKAEETAGALKSEYSFDVKGNYILQIIKGALYAKMK